MNREEGARAGRKRVSDVNLIPKKEAIAYLERSIPVDIIEAETYRMLINLLERGLIDAGYQNGHVAFQARTFDPFTALVSVVSTSSEQEFKTMLPELRKMTEKYKKELKIPFKKGTISEPIIEVLKSLSEITASVSEIKFIQAQSLEEIKIDDDAHDEITSTISEHLTRLTVFETKISVLLEEIYRKDSAHKEISSKISDYFSILSEIETRIPNIIINEMVLEIKKLLEEAERKILEDERWINQFQEIIEKSSNESVPEIKRALSELRKQLEER